MRIKEVTDQLGNDFWADMVCEHCGHIQKLSSGYNDTYYHQKVIPAMKCSGCGLDRSGERKVA